MVHILVSLASVCTTVGKVATVLLTCTLCRYSLVPIVPRDILEYVQLPSTYIMGVPSQYSDELPESVSAYICTFCVLFSSCDACLAHVVSD